MILKQGIHGEKVSTRPTMRDIKVDTRRHSRQYIVLCFVGIQIKEALARVIL
jgi:hypothetical protein